MPWRSIPARYIARWNGATWQPLGSGMNYIVYALTVYNGELIAGGYFTTAGGNLASKIARWDGATWQALGSGMNRPVNALTVYNDELIAGGAFSTAGGHVSAYWARWGPVVGACCFADGHCERLADAECTAAGGTYQGDNTACDPNPCPQPPATGACCFVDGHCEPLTQASCTTASGTYEGDGTACDPNPCPQPPETGACCYDNGSCQVKTEAQCMAGGGDYQGDDATCAAADCPQPPSCAYELTTAVDGQGSVAASPSHDTYGCNASVSLTATADECWHFVHWQGALSGTTNPAALTMSVNKSVTAVFEIDQYTLDVTAEGEGSVALDPTGGTYDCGTTVHLTATAEPGWHFVRWQGDASGTDTGDSVVMSADRQVTAVFEPDVVQYTLTVTTQGEGAVDPPGGTYDAGTTVTLTATPSSGWHFVRWAGDASGTDAGSSVVMSQDRNVTAVFEQDTADTSDNDEQSDTALPDRPAQGGCGGVCPAASGGMIGLMLAGLLRGRATIRRVRTR